MSEESSKKLWGGRFSSKTNPLLEKLNSSIEYDQRMWSEDIQGSKAYAHALYLAGILNEEEEIAIHKGLEMVASEWANKSFMQKPEDEDIHTANERRLKELIGAPATKLHTGRSRNDQVATDLRLWLRSKIIDLKNEIKHLIQIQVQRAKTEIGILMPGYTHLQRAQVVQWSHWLLSHTWNLKEDAERLMQIHERVNVMPLGSGAIAGNPFPINRSLLAKDLGFAKFSYNSMNAVGNRDFIAEFLSWATLVAIHLSQIAEDLIIFSSSGFGFVSLDESFSTGSSLMPQKRNPDSLELIRGKTGRISGNNSGFLMTLKGLPSTYNKDLQEDKGALFDTYDNLKNMLAVAAGVIQTLTVNEERCVAALSPELLATDLAYYLVRKGVPFREAHHISGEVVKLAEKLKVDISSLPVQQLREISDKFEDNVIKVWDYRSSVEQYQAIGGTSTNSITQQIHILEQWLE